MAEIDISGAGIRFDRFDLPSPVWGGRGWGPNPIPNSEIPFEGNPWIENCRCFGGLGLSRARFFSFLGPGFHNRRKDPVEAFARSRARSGDYWGEEAKRSKKSRNRGASGEVWGDLRGQPN